jgi:uncharacterized Zn-finger protein
VSRHFLLSPTSIVIRVKNLKKCDVCEKKFANKSDLFRNIWLHSGDKPYNCDVYEKKCADKFHLVRHVILHSGDKPYRCDECVKEGPG